MRSRNRGKTREFVACALLLGVGVGVGLAASLVPGCGGGGGARPVASLAFSRDAAAAFAPIRDAWSAATKPGARAELREPLKQFLARFPTDGLAPLAHAYLAFALIDAGQLAPADLELQIAEATPPGSTRDLAMIGRARWLRLMKRPDAAFEELRPLVGKIVDAASRAILQEEVSLAAIDAHRDYEAVAYMDTWLRNASEEDHEAVRAKVVAALGTIAEPVLENALRAMRSGGAASGYGREIQRLVTERLAQIALARNDSDLARWLVSNESSGATLGTEEGALGELATTHRGLATVDGRTIGLVLPTGSPDLRDEAAAVMRGAARALDLPRADPAAGDRTKLVTRDDGGDVARVEPAMSELAGEGAAIILAALDPESANRAVKWGEEHGVVVITLAVPSTLQAREWAFVAGVPHDAQIAVLGEELVSRGIARVVPILPPPTDGPDAPVQALTKGSVELAPTVTCDTAAAMSGEAKFPLDAWKSDKVKGWLVDAPAECSRDLIRALDGAQLTGTVGLTLGAAAMGQRAARLRLLAVKAGGIPTGVTAPDLVQDPEIRAYWAREGVPPNIWVALGHDAAALARRAVAELPLDETSDPTSVKKRRAAVKGALGRASVHLWTSAATGFGAAQYLARELGAVELPVVDRKNRE